MIGVDLTTSWCQQISDLRVGLLVLPLNPLKGTSNGIFQKKNHDRRRFIYVVVSAKLSFACRYLQ